MTQTIRLSLLLTSLMGAAACSGGNEPAVSSDGGAGGTPGVGGDGAGGDGSGGEVSTGGTDGGGSGGEVSTGGSSGSGGSTGGAAGGGQDFDPPCALTQTVAGEEIKKGVACTDEDPQLCWRKCGPQGVGWKSETCSAGVYTEGDCQFPTDGDYSCYALPDTWHEDCPDETPQASEPCTVPVCNPCNVDNEYLTSSGEQKVGYCVCQAGGTWSCASGAAWPCPAGRGC